jgi:hypothetical protein
VVLKRLAQLAWTAGATTIAYSDESVTDILLGVGVDPYHDTPPSDANNIAIINDQLCVWGTTLDPEYVYKSQTGLLEYFSDLVLGKDDATAFTYPTVGMKIKIGASGEPVMALMPIGENYGVGNHSSYILALTRTGAKELWGKDWVDSSLKEGSADGLVSKNAAANYKGLICWVSANGPVAKSPGDPTAMPLYNDLFPQISKPFSEQVTAGAGTADYFSLCEAVIWREFFVMTWAQSTSTSANKMAMIHIPTGAITEIANASDVMASGCLCVLSGPQDNGELLMGSPTVGTIYKMFTLTGSNSFMDGVSLGVPVVARIPLIDKVGNKKIGMDRIKAYFRKPSSTQAVTIKTYLNGSSTNSGTTGEKSLLSTESTNRCEVDAALTGTANLLEVEVSGTFTVPVTLEELVPYLDAKLR